MPFPFKTNHQRNPPPNNSKIIGTPNFPLPLKSSATSSTNGTAIGTLPLPTPPRRMRWETVIIN